MAKKTISISLSEELFKLIEGKRQLIPRSTYIEFVLKKELIENGK